MYTEVRERAMKIINFKKKKNEVINKWKTYENAKKNYICKEKFEDQHAKEKKNVKLGTIAIIQVNTEVLLIEYVI